ncbi:alpha-hydroxy-acid oxidizing protein [Roseomonas chloroacetimidivorans]|uniref:alpha-hydroxy-acid oxidizing protein n=1 Tax=Roseomonas chloroacetimidivorans TaxID=1766656 RepID=UPI003C7364B6
MESFLQRAETSGHEAIVVTLDTTELGWRPRDLDHGHLAFLHERGIANYVSAPVFGRLSFDDASSGEQPPIRPGALPSVLQLLRSWPGGSLRARLPEEGQRIIQAGSARDVQRGGSSRRAARTVRRRHAAPVICAAARSSSATTSVSSVWRKSS